MAACFKTELNPVGLPTGERSNDDGAPSTDTNSSTSESSEQERGAEETVEVRLAEDMNDGDIVNELEGTWVAVDDNLPPDNGDSVVHPGSWYEGAEFEMSAPGYGGTGYAARLWGTTGNKLGFDFIGLYMSLGPHCFCPNAKANELNVAQYDGIRFMAKGTVSSTFCELWVSIPHVDGTLGCGIGALVGDTLTEYGDYRMGFF